MSIRVTLAAIACGIAVAAAWPAGADPAAGGSADDPYLWLEQVDSPRAMDWVRAENLKTAAVLEQDPRYPLLYKDALAIAQAEDRIPQPNIVGGTIYNFWQDARHAHGLWRRTTLQQYRQAHTAWTPVIDLDALSSAEKGNWFWSGARCAEPAERLCMIALSDGGEDAVTEREFDLRAGKFVTAGFALPKGKQSAVWENEHSLLVSREWSPGELTASGYPYIVKRLSRGQPLAAAKEIFRGSKADVEVDPVALYDGDGHQALIVQRAMTFFESEFQLLTPQGCSGWHYRARPTSPPSSPGA